jgi:hypothetical protein
MPSKKMRQKYIKNNRSLTSDGEIVRDDYYLIYEPFKEGTGYNFKYRSAFIKSYLGISLPYGEKGFSDLELGRIYRISRLMYSDSNLLARRSNNKIVPITRDEIQLMLKMHRTKFVPFWKKVLDYHILKSIPLDGDSFFCMNPLYYNSTTYMPVHIYLAFQKDIESHIPQWVIEKYLELQVKPEKEEKKESEENTNV